MEQIEAELSIARSDHAAATIPLTSITDGGQQTYYGGSTAERVMNSVNTRRTMAATQIRNF